ncbi:MAG: sugar phosphate isomerase/epimerase [Actinobacteria bacterium]|nr:sugar phosphate isomerase/epimerase [Actinomycetota bacterium]
MVIKTSIGAWAYIWGGYKEDPIPLKTVVEKLSGLGFDGVELAAFPPHMEPNTKEKRKEIKKMLDDYGLKVSGLAAPFPSPSTSSTEDYLKAVKDNLEVCKDLDIPKLRVDTVDPPTKIPSGMDYETCIT